MRQTPYIRKSCRRILATAGFVVALATTACGSPVAGATSNPVPTPGPVTADSIGAAFANSTMDNGHFKLHGTIIKNKTYFPVTGDGVLQMRPQQALQMNLNVQTYGSQGVVRIQEIAIGTRLWLRTGTGKWTAKRESASPTNPSSYVGEEIISGVAVWHALSKSGSSQYDIWIRESDGYPVQMVYASTSGKLTMNFNSFNTSATIIPPQ
ncbi:MAG: hypothetical protein ABI959_10095 [Candidatus Dormiibacterota bacterium]